MDEHSARTSSPGSTPLLPWQADTGYRADIDGLRAVAVLAVVFYHAHLAGFAGGYVGVDIFFVISGFLITRIIAGEIDRGTFRLARFYERRIRRIFPALFAMLFATTAFALWLLFPNELKNYNYHLRGTLLFVSNFTLADKTDYFADAADTQPLMHTWSLAVEEQFYLLFPLMMVATLRWFKGRFVTMVAIIAGLSFIAALWSTYANPARAFFMPHVRTFELAVGALIALGAFPRPRSAVIAEVASIVGVGLIIWAVAFQSGDLPFPGLGAVPPVLGSALLIWSGSGTPTATGRLLALKPVVFIGLISYSLYLWHWPVFVYGKMIQAERLTETQAWAAIAVSIGLATLSWRFVELPFRRKALCPDLRSLVKPSAAIVVGLIAVTLVGDWTEGLPQRHGERIHAFVNAKEDWRTGMGRHCLRLAPTMIAAQDAAKIPEIACKIGDPDAEPTFLLWGDSTAAAIQPAIEIAAKRKKVAGYVTTWSACKPLPGVFDDAYRKGRQCGVFNDLVREFVLASPIDHVFLHGLWSTNYFRLRRNNDGRDTDPRGPWTDAENAAFEARASGSLGTLASELVSAGKRVTIIANLPHFQFDPPLRLARAALAGRTLPTGMPRSQADAQQRFADAILAKAAATDGVTVIRPHEILCDDRICPLTRDGQSLYADAGHISPFAARLLVDLLAGAL